MTERAIESLSRGLAVIEALNRRAYTTLSELHEETQLPKSTLVRLLDTLIATGYARRISRATGYCLTDRVTLLADGFQSIDRIVDVSRQHLKKLTEDHKWPVVLATLDGDAMLARYSTLSYSPFALDRIYIGRRIGLLVSAMGRAFLAHTSPETRVLLLAALRGSGAKMDQLAHDSAYVEQLLETIRRDGYACTDLVQTDRAFGIAVPVMKYGEPQAAIAMRFIRSAINPAAAGATFAPILRETAARIADEL